MDPELEAIERRRSERAILKRKSLGTALGEADMVAMFSHHRVIDPKKISITEHRPANEKKAKAVYTIQSNIHENVLEVGNEVNTIDEGFDYAIAIVDKSTGQTTFRPARLFQFEARYTADPAVLLGDKRTEIIDFAAKHEISSDQWSLKRNLLTENFGSSKKMKIQEAAQKRAINNDTLDAMLKTAFASTSVVEGKADVKLEDISMIHKAQSSVLPPAVQAQLPKDIYPLTLFMTDEEVDAYGESAESFMKEKKKTLIENGFPKFVASMMSGVHNDRHRAAGFCLLGSMAAIFQTLGKNCTATKKAIDEINIPMDFKNKTMNDYLTLNYDRGVNGRQAERVTITKQQKDRFLAHLMALALTLSPSHSVLITPWQMELNIVATRLESILVALGCEVMNLGLEEAIKNDSRRCARLLHPPREEIKKRKIRR